MLSTGLRNARAGLTEETVDNPEDEEHCADNGGDSLVLRDVALAPNGSIGGSLLLGGPPRVVGAPSKHVHPATRFIAAKPRHRPATQKKVIPSG